MYSLFNSMPESLSAVARVPGWNNIRDGLKRNLDTVIRYYRNHPMAVQSDHFLVRLIQSIDVPLSQNIERYVDNVQTMALNLSMALKMTSSIYRGQIFPGVFYGPETFEVIIADNEDFDVFDAEKNWKDLQPIRVLRHPITDIALKLPNGVDNSTDSGIAVILVNIPMLATMYRSFRLEQASWQELYQENQMSTMQFVHMYVLPNMLYSHLDLAIFNRMHALAQGAPIGEAKRPHSFPLVDWDHRLTQWQTNMLALMEKIGRDFRGMMHEIPMVTARDLDDVMKLPDIVPTQQVIWSLSISRLPVLDFLVRVSKAGASTTNRNEVNYVLRQIRMYKRNSMMKVLTPDVLTEVMFEIDTIEAMLVDVNGR